MQGVARTLILSLHLVKGDMKDHVMSDFFLIKIVLSLLTKAVLCKIVVRESSKELSMTFSAFPL
jgi:hypothetical protein